MKTMKKFVKLVKVCFAGMKISELVFMDMVMTFIVGAIAQGKVQIYSDPLLIATAMAIAKPEIMGAFRKLTTWWFSKEFKDKVEEIKKA